MQMLTGQINGFRDLRDGRWASRRVRYGGATEMFCGQPQKRRARIRVLGKETDDKHRCQPTQTG